MTILRILLEQSSSKRQTAAGFLGVAGFVIRHTLACKSGFTPKRNFDAIIMLKLRGNQIFNGYLIQMTALKYTSLLNVFA